MIVAKRLTLPGYYVGLDLEAGRMRRRLCKGEVWAYHDIWTVIVSGVLLKVSWILRPASLTSRRFCWRTKIVSDILATRCTLSRENFVTTQPTRLARDPMRNNTCSYLFNNAFVVLTDQGTATSSAQTIIAGS